MMRILLVLMILMTPFNTFAEPNSSIKYLMTDKVSMLDWGLYKLENSLKGLDSKVLGLTDHPSWCVEYDWDKNTIKITCSVYMEDNISINQKATCLSVIKNIKILYGSGYSDISNFFQHNAFTKKDEPKTLVKDLQTMTTINVQIYVIKNDTLRCKKECSCTSRLMEDEVFFLDIKDKKKP